MAAVRRKNMYSIKSEADLHRLRDNLLDQFKEVDIKMKPIKKPKKAKQHKMQEKEPKSESNEGDDEKGPIVSTIMTKKARKKKGQKSKPNIPTDKEEDEKEGYEETTTKRGDMFDDVAEMEQSINIKGTRLQRQLIMMEKELIKRSAKKHISRKCHHPKCKHVAPANYPNNIYLCDTHKAPLRQKLQEYDIPCDQGSAEEKQKCTELKHSYQRVIDELKVPDNHQTFGNHQQQYPQNYFVVTMAKLMACDQELSKPLPASQRGNAQLKASRRKMKKIVKQLMDLLILARQNLNCHWTAICGMIIGICTTIGAGFAWMVANAAYIAVIFGFLGFFIGVLIAGFIFCTDPDKLFCIGAAAVGTAVGVVAGISAMAGIIAGGEIGATIGTALGPGPGTALGAAVGGICGGLFAGGVAMMAKFG